MSDNACSRGFVPLAALWVAGFVAIAMGILAVALEPPARHAPGILLGGMHFAIADLDGDTKPDLAVAEPVRSSGDLYVIRLHFGSGVEFTIGVNAPEGGLEIAARDVNGDDILDLVVTSEYDARVVGVFLNDGHGQFSAAEPDTYSTVGQEVNLSFRDRPLPSLSPVLLTEMRSSSGAEENPSGRVSSSHWSESLAALGMQAASRELLGAIWGRAPPACS